MKRPAIALLIVVIVNFANTAAFGCGSGGYRPSVRVHSYRAPQVYHAPVRRQVIVQQPVQTIRTITVAAPRPTVVATPQRSPIRLAPTQQVRTAPQPSVSQPVNAPSQPAAQASQQPTSALALLMGQSGQSASQTQTIPTSTSSQPATPSHVGTWQATTPGKATVTLTLNNDNSFSWVASNQGKSSQFHGTYTLSDDKLTLARSSDNQKLTGDFAFSNSGFNFKLSGAKDNGLNFTR